MQLNLEAQAEMGPKLPEPLELPLCWSPPSEIDVLCGPVALEMVMMFFSTLLTQAKS